MREIRKCKLIHTGKAHWTSFSSDTGRLKWEFEYKRITFTLTRKRRDKLMGQLEKHNQDLHRLIGTSEKLGPMRKKRKSPITAYFQQIRDHARSLHSALTQAWRCSCPSGHPIKLLLESRLKADETGTAQIKDASAIKFQLFFCPEQHSLSSATTLVAPHTEWCGTEVKLLESTLDRGRRASQATSAQATSYANSGSQSQRRGSNPTRQTVSLPEGRKVSFASDHRKHSVSSYSSDATEITDLCTMLSTSNESQGALGFLRDDQEGLHVVELAANSLLGYLKRHRIISLEDVLTWRTNTSDESEKGMPTLSRRTRLTIAVTLANSLLQLHTSPWLGGVWGKSDIHFFEGEDGTVHTQYPFLVRDFASRIALGTRGSSDSQVTLDRTTSRSCNSSLLSLGILILELWFNQTIESRPFRRNFLGPNGKANEYTDFNTAQKWQEQALEEAGMDFHNATRRCIYCAFGAVSQDLEDEELRRAVYSEVVQPLQRILAQFEEA